jgi:acetyl esterase/lipase
MKVWLLIRATWGLLTSFLALHLVVLIDTLPGWKLTLAAGEYGHRLALVTLLVLVCGAGVRSIVAIAGSLLLFLSSIVLLWPSWQAYGIIGELPARFAACFGRDAAGGGTLDARFRGLWFGEKPSPCHAEAFTYASDRGVDRRLHLFRGARTGAAPCIVVIHGGGWENGDPLEFPEWDWHWSAAGYAVACVEYRLAPRHRWPAAREDIRKALDWLKSHAAGLGIDPRRFILLGRSAGGQIASACAYGLRDPDVVGCVAIYAPHDMFFARRFAFEDDVLSSLRLLRNYLGGDPADVATNYHSASGFMLADAKACPTLLIHGTRDTLVWNMQSRRMAERLRTLKAPHLLLELPWAAHGMDWPFDGPGGQLTRVAVDGFLKTVAVP